MSSKLEKLASSLDTTQEQFLELFEKDYEYSTLIAKNPEVDIVVTRTLIQDHKGEVVQPNEQTSFKDFIPLLQKDLRSQVFYEQLEITFKKILVNKIN